MSNSFRAARRANKHAKGKAAPAASKPKLSFSFPKKTHPAMNKPILEPPCLASHPRTNAAQLSAIDPRPAVPMDAEDVEIDIPPLTTEDVLHFMKPLVTEVANGLDKVIKSSDLSPSPWLLEGVVVDDLDLEQFWDLPVHQEIIRELKGRTLPLTPKDYPDMVFDVPGDIVAQQYEASVENGEWTFVDEVAGNPRACLYTIQDADGEIVAEGLRPSDAKLFMAAPALLSAATSAFHQLAAASPGAETPEMVALRTAIVEAGGSLTAA